MNKKVYILLLLPYIYLIYNTYNKYIIYDEIKKEKIILSKNIADKENEIDKIILEKSIEEIIEKDGKIRFKNNTEFKKIIYEISRLSELEMLDNNGINKIDDISEIEYKLKGELNNIGKFIYYLNKINEKYVINIKYFNITTEYLIIRIIFRGEN